ncbi:MAG: poly-gamma-glutamate biosynthesis protein PgsC/CapC, partial [Candidatus Nanopelagicales bacterium]|nr:poly-gamma-glutamate biosynthesis protein PgsC/CapC [Candidatus Nanopelagicales bacterium]
WFVILILEQRWSAVLVTLVIAFLTVALMRLFVLRRWAVSKAWQASLTVMISVFLNGLFAILMPALNQSFADYPVGFILSIGLYVTPGLIAYDYLRQGVTKTLIAISLVVVVSLVASVPVVIGLSQLVQGGSTVVIYGQGRIPTDLWWLGTLVAVSITVMLKLSVNWRAGGFLAGLFAYEALNAQSLLLAILFALATFALVKAFARIVVLTPRQRFQVSLLLGALLSWFGLYWFTQLNFVPAIVANGYPLAPLLIVGLLASDFGRKQSSVVTTVLGVLFVTAAVAGAVFIAQTWEIGSLVVVGLLVLILAVWFSKQSNVFSQSIRPAIAIGSYFGSTVAPLGVNRDKPAGNARNQTDT